MSVFFWKWGEVSFLDIETKEEKIKYKDYDILVNMTSKYQKETAIAKARAEGEKTATYNPVRFGLDGWVHFGIILSFFISLIFAIPATWKRKLLAFIVGLVILEAFMIFKLWVSINLKYSVRYETFHVGWTNEQMIQGLNHISNIITFPFFGFLLMTIIGILFLNKMEEPKKLPLLSNSLPTSI